MVDGIWCGIIWRAYTCMRVPAHVCMCVEGNKHLCTIRFCVSYAAVMSTLFPMVLLRKEIGASL